MNWKTYCLPLLCLVTSCTDTAKSYSGETDRFLATAVGRIDSAEEARQLVASVDGTIFQVHVRRGQKVNAGDILMSIDCRVRNAAAQAALADAGKARAQVRLLVDGARSEERARGNAQLAVANARHDDAIDKLKRAEALVDRGFITVREITRLHSVVAETAGDVTARQAEMEILTNGARPDEIRAAQFASTAFSANAHSAQEASNQCNIRSPINGQVLQILRFAGEFSGASQGQPLIVIGNLDKLIVHAEVNERDASSIKIGQRVEIWMDWGQPHWKGRVVELANIMGRRSARSLDPSDRFDRDIREAIIELETPAMPALVGLRVTIGFVK